MVKISPLALTNISLVRCAPLRNIFQHFKVNFVSPYNHVIYSILSVESNIGSTTWEKKTQK